MYHSSYNEQDNMKSFKEFIKEQIDFDDSKSIEHIIKKTWGKIKKTIMKKFDGGFATCTVATFELGNEFYKKGISFVIMSGEFKGIGHWWIVVNTKSKNNKFTRKICDLGDNISEKHINSGIIKPKYINFPNNDYKMEDSMKFDEYKKLYQSKLKNF